MLADAAPAVHALLRVSDLDALVWEAGRPGWASASLQRAPWVVMRRPAPRSGVWPVGVRGGLRAHRGAAWLPGHLVRECMTPQQLAAKRAWRQRPCTLLAPAVASLDEVAAIMAGHGFAGHWGPGGSVGFELASGVSSTTSGSDLDLVLRADAPMPRSAAIRLHADLTKLAVRVDLQLETPLGAVLLAEYVKTVDTTLLRTAVGPRLVRDPWRAGSTAGRV